MTNDELAAKAERAAEVREINEEIVAYAADLYGQFLSSTVPANKFGIVAFDPAQAFELVKTLIYEGIKDAEIV